MTFTSYSIKKKKIKKDDRQTGFAYTNRQQSRKKYGRVWKRLSQPTQSRDKNTGNLVN